MGRVTNIAKVRTLTSQSCHQSALLFRQQVSGSVLLALQNLYLAARVLSSFFFPKNARMGFSLESNAVVLSLYEAQMSALAILSQPRKAFCCPDFRVTTWALCIDPPFAKFDSG
jgi:hypothetical protein